MEKSLIDLPSLTIDKQKLLTPEFFISVKFGDLGQLYWDNAATMKDEKGNSFPCEYDISPEYIYHHSVSV